MTFLYHTYPEDSGKGKSTCQFTLGEVYYEMTNGKNNPNVTHNQLIEESLNKTSIETLLKGIQKKARGKK